MVKSRWLWTRETWVQDQCDLGQVTQFLSSSVMWGETIYLIGGVKCRECRGG